MLNASVGVQRVLGRLRIGPRRTSTRVTRFHRRSLDLARRVAGIADPARIAATRPSVPIRVGARLRHSEVAVPLAVAAVVVAASVVSVLPDAVPAGPIGGPHGAGVQPRLAVGGALPDGYAFGAPNAASFRPLVPAAVVPQPEPEPTAAPVATGALDGTFLEDGTLLKPVAVDTTVADGSDLLRTYTVKPGDSLVGIAEAHDVSMMTVWWANGLKSKSLVVGQVLTIPPVDGLVVKVAEGDTLDSLAKEYSVDADEIYRVNGLEDRALVIGQTLILPGAKGDPIPTPTPRPRPVARSGGTVSGPATYAGGAFVWPVVGGGNYISQGYRSGHLAIDIAADYGSTVRAAAAGTVVFAGWKNNGGGYQVHIAHGSGLYTTYNHMSAVSVGTGQSVAKGQQVGRVGQSGWATGPHLHFEVWQGGIWNGGRRVNPLAYF